MPPYRTIPSNEEPPIIPSISWVITVGIIWAATGNAMFIFLGCVNSLISRVFIV
jgi:hypothetical protein